MLLGEVGKLREERRNIQLCVEFIIPATQLSYLLTNPLAKSVLSCVCEASTKLVACSIQIGKAFRFVLFGALTHPICLRKPSTGPLAPQPPADLPPDEPSAPAAEPPRPGAWRSIHQRGGFRRTRKKSEGRPGPVIETPMQMQPSPGPPPDRAQAAGSWATWQGKLPSSFFLLPFEAYTRRQRNLAITRRRQVNPRFI
jgi:hypothetical protein